MSVVCIWFDLTDGLGRKSLVIAEVQTLSQRGHFTKYKFINVAFYHCDPNACSLK